MLYHDLSIESMVAVMKLGLIISIGFAGGLFVYVNFNKGVMSRKILRGVFAIVTVTSGIATIYVDVAFVFVPIVVLGLIVGDQFRVIYIYGIVDCI